MPVIALLLSLLMAAPVFAADALRLISYEALPSAQTELTFDNADYAERAAAAQEALTLLAPRIAETVGLDPARIETQITPGGYLLKTNASLQSMVAAPEEEVDRFAAALGYVFRQWSVMVSALDAEDGRTGFVTVRFPKGALTPFAAQSFFEAAASVDEGLGGGYTAFGDEMIFLNVRDGRGAPYSGLDDMKFAARMGEAAAGFAAGGLRIAGAGFADARFIGNDWDRAPQGEDYAARLRDVDLQRLDALREVHDQMIARLAKEYGWN